MSLSSEGVAVKQKGPGRFYPSDNPPIRQNSYTKDVVPFGDFPMVSFTLGCAASGAPQSKQHSVGPDGKIKTDLPEFPTSGTFKHILCPLKELPKHFKEQNKFMVLGTVNGSAVGDTHPITTKGKDIEGGITRTKDNFEFAPGKTYPLLIDVDLKTENCIPPMLAHISLDSALMPIHEALANLLRTGLSNIAMVMRPSSSAGIKFADGTSAKDSEGMHIFIAVKGKTPEELLKFLFKQLVINGQGHAYVTRRGTIDIRTYIDAKVGETNRVSFEACPLLGPGLFRDAKDEERPGGALDLTNVELTIDEEAFKARCEELRAAPGVRELVDQRKKVFSDGKKLELISGGSTEEEANITVERLFSEDERLDLYPKDKVVFRFDDERRATIADILADPKSYHDHSLMDPTDDKNRQGKAKFYFNDGNGLFKNQFVVNLIRSGRQIFLHGEDIEAPAPVLLKKISSEAERTAIFNEALLVAHADLTSDLKKGFAKRLGMNVGDFAVALKQCRKSTSIEGEQVDGDQNDGGRKSATLANIIKALGDPQICNLLIAFDEFLGTEVKSNVESPDWQTWTDEDSILMREYLSLNGYKEVSAEIMRDALCGAATKNRIDTAQIWSESLPAWDGTPRCASFYIDHFGVEDSDYAKAVGEYTWSALAGRIMVPGIKADMVPALCGAQGQRKSSGIAAMAPSRDRFVEISFHDKEDDIKRKMEGRYVAELAELAGLVKRDQDWLKQFIVCRVDERRPNYKERIRKYSRRLLFIATTNKPQFLSDTTGNRRWLPLPTGQVNVGGIIDNREQLWAEAFVLFNLNGVMFERAETLAQTKLEDHTEESTDSDMIARWLDTLRFDDLYDTSSLGFWRDQTYITTEQIFVKAFDGKKADIKKMQGRISDAMRLLGWESLKRRHETGKESFRAWVKKGGG